MPMNAPLGECYDACFDIMNNIVEMSQKAAERAKRSLDEKEAKDKAEEAVEEVDA